MINKYILTNIFLFVNYESSKNIRLVSKKWNQVYIENFNKLHNLHPIHFFLEIYKKKREKFKSSLNNLIQNGRYNFFTITRDFEPNTEENIKIYKHLKTLKKLIDYKNEHNLNILYNIYAMNIAKKDGISSVVLLLKNVASMDDTIDYPIY